jgi:hypothetical protein
LGRVAAGGTNAFNRSKLFDNRKTYDILVGEPGRKRPLGIPRYRWEDNIKMDLTEIRWAGACEHGNEPSGCIKFQKFHDCRSNYQLVKGSDAGVQLSELS